MNSPKILVVIGHGLYEPWLNILHEGQRKTWLRWPVPENMKIIHMHGTPLSKVGWKIDRIHERIRWKNVWVAKPLEYIDRIVTLPFRAYIPKIQKSKLLVLEQEVIQVKFPDSYLNMVWKNLALWRYFISKTDYDFLFFTTTSSLIKPFALSELISRFDPNDSIYAGVRPYKGANFAAGNNRLLSRPAAQLLLDKRLLLDPAIIEDKGIGLAFERLGVSFIELPSLNITSVDETKSPDFTNKLNANFHIRVKSGTFTNRDDVELMNIVYSKLNALGGPI